MYIPSYVEFTLEPIRIFPAVTYPVKAPAVAFRADIEGWFGIIELSEIKNKETPVEIVKAHKGALEEAACIIPASFQPPPNRNGKLFTPFGVVLFDE
jgi:hypothetical protein